LSLLNNCYVPAVALVVGFGCRLALRVLNEYNKKAVLPQGNRAMPQVFFSNGEIIFEEFQPMWSQFTNVTDGRTDGRTDRRHAIAIPRFALKCIAR